MASARKRRPTLRELAATEPTAEEREALEAWLDLDSGSTLRPADFARLWKGWTDVERRSAGALLARDLLGRRPAKPTKSYRARGNRYTTKGATTEGAIYDAVARALSDGVTGLGRAAVPSEPKATGYEAWRARQPDGVDLPGGRWIHAQFKPRKTKRDRDVWSTVVRLGRKAGRIP